MARGAGWRSNGAQPVPAALRLALHAAAAALARRARTWVHLRMGSSVISRVVSSTWLMTPHTW